MFKKYEYFFMNLILNLIFSSFITKAFNIMENFTKKSDLISIRFMNCTILQNPNVLKNIKVQTKCKK